MATPDYTDEVWRAIDDAPMYAVSNLGRVRRTARKRNNGILKPSRQRGGYLGVTLCFDGKKLYRKVHRLVCAAFNGPQPADKSMCAHDDGKTSNNTAGNLYWATALENAQDRERHGTMARGDRSGPRLHPERLTRGDAHWTRKCPGNVPRGAAHYAKLAPALIPRGSARHNAKLTEDSARAIIAEPARLGSGRMLAERYGITMGLVTAIRKGRAWAHLPRSDR